jgi:formylglycine-generating enzyme required for sulfatase activity
MRPYSSQDRFTRLRLGVSGVLTATLMTIGPTTGCGVIPAPAALEITHLTGTGTLVQGQVGSVVITCRTDDAAQSVVANLAALGGTTGQALAKSNGNEWSWTGQVTPLSAGQMTVSLTASGSANRSGTAQVALSVAAPDPNRLVVDLGRAIVIEMVRLPAGSFQMGTNSTDMVSYYQSGTSGLVSSSDWANAARPLHTVTFGQSFFMGRHPVTQAQWLAVMGENPSQNQSDPNLPVENIAWNDAVAFCQALTERVGRTFRLPSEAEWEYGCKAGGGDTAYSFGNDAGTLSQYAWYIDNSGGFTHPVGQKLPNAFGLYDVHGNVWEWCQDPYHATYADAPTDGSAWVTGGNTAFRAQRGGSTGQTAGACRSAWRNFFPPTDHYPDSSLRLVAP